LGNTVIGAVSPQALPRMRSMQTPWLVSHIALSLVLCALGLHHAWTALYFE
jgi:hypothetical protein